METNKERCRNCDHEVILSTVGILHRNGDGKNHAFTVECSVDGCECVEPELEPTRTVIEVIPSARRLIKSLRDEGYDFLTAAADIIDNSLQAGAKNINIRMEFNGDHSWFQIADDGKGMTDVELTEAMRFGTEREYGTNELGKFGLGLKTASISQCRKLTVASRSNAKGAEIEIRQLNIDRIEETNRWEILSIPKKDYSELLWESLLEHPGTVVQWEAMDRMMQYDPPDGMRARNGFVRLTRELEMHVSMVFHRFISGELGDDKKITISINGTPIDPWDPFVRKEKTVEVEQNTIAVVGSYGVFKVHYKAYVLPPKEKFSSLSAFNRAAGSRGWNLQQGFYVYRENRLIQSGGWCRMRVPDEHTKLARVAMDLGTDADFSLALNIMKTSITLPANMKRDLDHMVTKVMKLAKEAYRPEKKEQHKPPKPEPDKKTYIWIPPEQRPPQSEDESLKHEGPGKAEEKRQDESESETLAISLERVAGKIGEIPALRRIRTALLEDNPDAASKIGW